MTRIRNPAGIESDSVRGFPVLAMTLLIINRSDCKCDNCGKSANMYETGHFTQLGYVNNGSPGCGEIWTGVTSDYFHIPEQLVESDRGYFFAENLRGLPVYGPFQKEPIGVYGGTTGTNEAMQPLSEEEDSSISEDDSLPRLPGRPNYQGDN